MFGDPQNRSVSGSKINQRTTRLLMTHADHTHVLAFADSSDTSAPDRGQPAGVDLWFVAVEGGPQARDGRDPGQANLTQ